MSMFHVTHQDNLHAILLDGIRPVMARSKPKRSWLCTIGRVDAMLNHVAKTHGWNPSHLRVIAVNISQDGFHPYAVNGHYYSLVPIGPECLRAIPEEWVDLLFRKSPLSKAALRCL